MHMTFSRVVLALALALVACAPEQLDAPSSQEVAAAIVPAGSGIDQDCDGVSDELEPARGMSATNPHDGKRDEDGDGLRGAEEIRLGGDPFRNDTDRDGEPDTTDLVRGLDLDGDGIPTERDNCRNVRNAAQRDTDKDGKGDLCDDTMTGAAPTPLKIVHVAQNQTRGDLALIESSSGRAGRSRPDRAGYLDTGTTFAMFTESGPGLTPVYELVHPTTKRHVYAAGNVEMRQHLNKGFSQVFPFGAVAASAPSYGPTVQARRFERNVDGTLEQAVTVADREAKALLAGGFKEITPLGWVLADEGRLVKPKIITRHRRANDSATLHSMYPASEALLASYGPDGERFMLLPEPNGWTVPVFRLRNSAGVEILATNESEAPSLAERGFKVEGVLGWALRDEAAVQSIADTAKLVRLSNGTRFEHSADPDEIAALKSRGFENEIVLGRAVRLPPRSRRPNGVCVGDLNLIDRVRQGVASNAPQGTLQLHALHTFAFVHTLNRILNGRVESRSEQRMTQALRDITPAVRATLRALVAGIPAGTASARAALLGNLASLDPFASAGPVDFDAIRYATMRMMSEAAAAARSGGGGGGGGLGDGVFNNGVSGGLSINKLRAPQCQGGVSYATPAAPGSGERAVTVGIWGVGESIAGAILPGVAGVRDDGVTLPEQGQAALNYAKQHENVGLPLIGIDIGPCTAGCAGALGQRCDDQRQRCRQYPVVRAGSMPTFSGANFWDTIGPRIYFTEVGTTNPIPFEGDVHIPEPIGPDYLAMRCNITPLAQNAKIRAAGDAAATCPVAGQTTPQCPADVSQNLPAEQRLEWMRPKGPISVTPDRFYKVQVQNTNGNYYPYRAPVSINPIERVTQGRTIHFCGVGAKCTTPNPVTAACTTDPIPTCGGNILGTWTVPPRPIEDCRAFDFEPIKCPETPHVFRSEDDPALPRLVYVTSPDAPMFVQTHLNAVKCLDETGIDAFGTDELIVFFANLSSRPTQLDDIKSLSGGLRSFEMDMNAGNVKRPPETTLLGSQRITRTAGESVEALLIAMEDDDISAGGVIAGAVAAIGTAVFSIATAGVGFLIVVAAVAASSGAFFGTLGSVSLFSDEDDRIGQVSWRVTTNDLLSRSSLTHDSVLGAPAADPTPFTSLYAQDHVRSRQAGRHPAVDGFTFDSNDQILSCSSNAQCTNGRICKEGACVPPNWFDPTVPLGTFDPAKDVPGVIERIHLDDEGEYVFWVSTSLSDEDGKTVLAP